MINRVCHVVTAGLMMHASAQAAPPHEAEVMDAFGNRCTHAELVIIKKVVRKRNEDGTLYTVYYKSPGSNKMRSIHFVPAEPEYALRLKKGAKMCDPGEKEG
jgi:hypothetical protein